MIDEYVKTVKKYVLGLIRSTDLMTNRSFKETKCYRLLYLPVWSEDRLIIRYLQRHATDFYLFAVVYNQQTRLESSPSYGHTVQLVDRNITDLRCTSKLTSSCIYKFDKMILPKAILSNRDSTNFFLLQ